MKILRERLSHEKRNPKSGIMTTWPINMASRNNSQAMRMDKTSLPIQINSEVSKFFQSTEIIHAIEFLKNSQVRIDYTRGKKEGPFYIVSGSVHENREFVSNLKYKKEKKFLNEEQSGEELTSSCDCINWSIERPCRHVAALFIKYHLQQLSKDEINRSNLISGQFTNDIGARPHQYGTLINRVQELEGVASNLDFNSGQYLLNNKKVINYPTATAFKGILKIILRPSYQFYLGDQVNAKDLNLDEKIISPQYEYISKDGNLNSEISIFEHTHLFNWSTGELFYFDNDLIDLVRKLRYQEMDITANDIIRYSIGEIKKGLVILEYKGKTLDLNQSISPNPRVTIVNSEKKNYLDFMLDFVDESEEVRPVPETLLAFVFDQGLLYSFKRKQDGYEYIQKVVDEIENEIRVNSSSWRKSSEKGVVKSYTHSFLDIYDEFVLDYENGQLLRYDRQFLKKFVALVYKNFGELFFRFSRYDYSSSKIVFTSMTNVILSGMSNFYHNISIYGVNIFYDKNQISKWNSRIRFERRQTNMNWFDLTLNIDNHDLDLIKKADPERDFALTTKGLVLLTPEQKDLIKFMKRYTKFEATSTQKKDDEQFNSFVIPFKKSRIFELFELKKLGVDGALTQEEQDLCHQLMTMEKMPTFDVPEIGKKVARPYQVTGYNWLRFLFENKLGACLADDMGLGKTLQTILFIKSVYEQINKVIIVCPVSIIMNWKNEFEKFSDLDVHIYYGGSRHFESDKKIILTSYGVMKKEFETTFAGLDFDIMILDEVQHLKNIRSLGATAARKINANFRICLTGTPVENDLSEFYNILDLSIPGIWGDLQLIRTVSNKKSRLIARKTARPFILRRTKSQVLTDLPEKIENHIYLNFSEDESNRYRTNLIQIKSKIENVLPRKRYGEILKGLLELRQLCLWQKGPQVESTKIDFLIENLEQIIHEGHQAIIFSQFTTYLDLIQKRIEDKTWKYSRIDGTRSFKRRQKDVDAFQDGTNPIFLISLKAGGVGLNLTAANYVFLMDPWWNPAVEAQAIDRAHRIGQKNKLTVYRPIIKNSVEEKVLKLQEIKKELFQDLMADNDDAYFTGKLTMKDFEGLF